MPKLDLSGIAAHGKPEVARKAVNRLKQKFDEAKTTNERQQIFRKISSAGHLAEAFSENNLSERGFPFPHAKATSKVFNAAARDMFPKIQIK